MKENKPKNVVTILCDGMGSNIMDKILSKDSLFFIILFISSIDKPICFKATILEISSNWLLS